MAIISVCAIGSGMVNPMLITIVMKQTPQHLLGRVMGVISAGTMIASPLGMIVVGPALDRLGLSGTFVAIGVILVAVFLMVITNRTIHAMDDVKEPTPQAA